MPVAIAAQRVDLTVVGEHPIRVRQLPARKGVGGEARVDERQARANRSSLQVREVLRDLGGGQHPLVDERATARSPAIAKPGKVELLDAAPDHVELALERVLVLDAVAGARRRAGGSPGRRREVVAAVLVDDRARRASRARSGPPPRTRAPARPRPRARASSSRGRKQTRHAVAPLVGQLEAAASAAGSRRAAGSGCRRRRRCPGRRPRRRGARGARAPTALARSPRVRRARRAAPRMRHRRHRARSSGRIGRARPGGGGWPSGGASTVTLAPSAADGGPKSVRPLDKAPKSSVRVRSATTNSTRTLGRTVPRLIPGLRRPIRSETWPRRSPCYPRRAGPARRRPFAR